MVEGSPEQVAPSATAPSPGEPWTVLRMILWSADYLEGKGVERARLDAEYLLADTLGLDRLQLYLQFDRPLIAEELDLYRPRLQRRARREPLQYILGNAPFRNLELAVDARVLIPRPETEGLVDHVLTWAERRGAGPLKVLDVGTGSGAIALALASERAETACVGTDVSAGALDVAAANGRALGVDVDWRLGEFFNPVRPGEQFDVVVSNPPYVLESERDGLAPEVRDHEPHNALFAGADGLDALRVLLTGAAQVVAPGGLFALEIGAEQGAAVVALAERLEGFVDARLYPDLASRHRYVLVTRTTEP